MLIKMLMLIVGLRIELRHGGLIPLDICLGDVCVDLVHRRCVSPAADLHRDLLRYLEVIGEGRETVT